MRFTLPLTCLLVLVANVAAIPNIGNIHPPAHVHRSASSSDVLAAHDASLISAHGALAPPAPALERRTRDLARQIHYHDSAAAHHRAVAMGHYNTAQTHLDAADTHLANGHDAAALHSFQAGEESERLGNHHADQAHAHSATAARLRQGARWD